MPEPHADTSVVWEAYLYIQATFCNILDKKQKNNKKQKKQVPKSNLVKGCIDCHSTVHT